VGEAVVLAAESHVAARLAALVAVLAWRPDAGARIVSIAEGLAGASTEAAGVALVKGGAETGHGVLRTSEQSTALRAQSSELSRQNGRDGDAHPVAKRDKRGAPEGFFGKRKKPARGGLFIFSILSSGYQVEGINPPNMIAGFGGYLQWNQQGLLW
jgi:hypothetical protein